MNATTARRCTVKEMIGGVAAMVLLSGAGLLMTGPAFAVDSHANFGQRVRMCAQTMGFDGSHNPGTHQGKSGWAPGHNCMME